MCVCACVRACVRACACVRVCVCVRGCVWVPDIRRGGKVSSKENLGCHGANWQNTALFHRVVVVTIESLSQSKV